MGIRWKGRNPVELQVSDLGSWLVAELITRKIEYRKWGRYREDGRNDALYSRCKSNVPGDIQREIPGKHLGI